MTRPYAWTSSAKQIHGCLVSTQTLNLLVKVYHSGNCWYKKTFIPRDKSLYIRNKCAIFLQSIILEFVFFKVQTTMTQSREYKIVLFAKNTGLGLSEHLCHESNLVNFGIPKLLKTVLSSPKWALSDRTMGGLLTKNVPAYGGFCVFDLNTVICSLYSISRFLV